MNIWAIADLHLSFGVANKAMDVFGDNWKDHPLKIKAHWEELIAPDDVVLLAGDISWAMTLEEARPDLLWIDQLPGTKVMIKGNHDYWWSSLNKLKAVLPPSIHALYNSAVTINDVSIGGSRLWDSPEYSFAALYGAEPRPMDPEDERVFTRELARLETSLQAMKPARRRIAMTHYPPIGLDLKPSRASTLFERFAVDTVVFGHLHFPLEVERSLFGSARGVNYQLTASDFLQFRPILL